MLRFPRRRLRALFPLAIAASAAWLYPDELLWTGLIVGIGLVGAVSVGLGDSRSALDGWQRRHPGLSFGRIAWFPTDTSIDAFDDVCAAVNAAFEALEGHRPVDRDGRAVVRRTRKELNAVLELGARLAVQIEQLERLPASARTTGVDSELRRAAERLDSLPGAARRLRDALLRSGPAAAAPDVAPLAAVLTLERGITAHSEALAELRGLEANS